MAMNYSIELVSKYILPPFENHILISPRGFSSWKFHLKTKLWWISEHTCGFRNRNCRGAAAPCRRRQKITKQSVKIVICQFTKLPFSHLATPVLWSQLIQHGRTWPARKDALELQLGASQRPKTFGHILPSRSPFAYPVPLHSPLHEVSGPQAIRFHVDTIRDETP